MRGKLVVTFWKKQAYFSVLVLLLFLVAGIATEYTLLDVMENYYKWKPIKELEGDWYFYKDAPEDNDKVEHFLIRRGAIDVLEFRRDHCDLEDPTDIGYEEHYDDGVLWQASADDVKIVQVFYPEAEDFQKTTDVIKSADIRQDTSWVITNVVTRLILWGIAIGMGVWWFRRTLRRSAEEISYLAYIGNDRRVLRKLYCNSVFVLLPLICVVSTAAILFPGENGNSLLMYMGYRQIYFPIPIAMFLLSYIMVLVFFWCCRHILYENELVKIAYMERGIQRIYISDFTVAENLQLVVMSQGFSGELAVTLTKLKMQEREIDFCAKRPMSMCPRDAKLVFYDLQEELMDSEPVEI